MQAKSSRWETLELEFRGDAPSAGQLLRSCQKRLGLKSDDVGAITTSAGKLWVDIDRRAGRRVLTPRPIGWPGGAGVLRRDSDLPSAGPAYAITVDTEFDSAGALGQAAFASGEIAGEDIGVIRRTDGSTTFTVPAWRYRSEDLPQALSGAPVRVEKKKPEARRLERRRAQRSAPTAIEYLRSVVTSDGEQPQVIRQAALALVAQAGTDAELHRAVRRLAAAGWSAPAPIPETEPWAVVLSLALAPRDRLEAARKTLRSLPFPTDGQTETEDLLELLAAERLGEPTPLDDVSSAVIGLAAELGLETRVLGTLAPGARATGRHIASDTPAPVGEDLRTQWLGLARAVAIGAPDASSRLDEVDRVMQAVPTAGDWPALRDLVAAEIAGNASPIRTPLAVLEPQSDRFVDTATAAIDERLRAGDIDGAAGLAERSARERPESSGLAARALRLTGNGELAVDDPVVLTLAGEHAWRSGRRELAVSAFSTAGPKRGSLTAQHVARRLAWSGHLDAAHALLGDESDLTLRLDVALALDFTLEASEHWAQRLGGRLGLVAPPRWAPASVRADLPPGWRALLEGRLSEAQLDLPWLVPRLAAVADDPFADWTAPTPAPPVGSALEAVLATPDPHDALISLVTHGIAPSDDVALWSWLGGSITPERWTPAGVQAWALLSDAGLNIPLSLSDATVLNWMRDDRVDFRQAAGAVVTRRPSAPLTERWAHTPLARLVRAEEALETGTTREARRIAAAILPRAVAPRVRRGATAILLEVGDTESLSSALGPDRLPALQFDVLCALQSRPADMPLPDDLVGSVRTLAASSPLERVREAAKRVAAGA